jgi:acyl-[acyl-carrier-protein] desaturase
LNDVGGYVSTTRESTASESQFEVIRSMEGFVQENLPQLLVPVEKSWQPSDFLPDLSREDWVEDVKEFRAAAAAIPDELLVVLVGDMITEEALPTYQTWLNRLQGVTDETGASNSPWAQWTRGWTSEENRHGDLLNRYLYLTGRVDMRSVETTIHHLINNGFDPQTSNDPYLGFVYTSFQERATKISHRNVGVLAKRVGEERLHKICGLIAGDESRHEKAYKLFMSRVFELDPTHAVLAFAKMMRRKITMPAVLMNSPGDPHLFDRFSGVAQRIGVYTARDYSEIIKNLVDHWKLENICGLSDVAAKAQEYLCTLSERYAKIAERMKTPSAGKFSWILERRALPESA